MVYWCVRHIATGQLMPQARRNRGYSHWNPAHPEHEFIGALDVPRLLTSKRSAERVIAGWAALPNGRNTQHQTTADGEWDDIVDFTDDGRTAGELEPVRVTLRLPR